MKYNLLGTSLILIMSSLIKLGDSKLLLEEVTCLTSGDSVCTRQECQDTSTVNNLGQKIYPLDNHNINVSEFAEEMSESSLSKGKLTKFINSNTLGLIDEKGENVFLHTDNLEVLFENDCGLLQNIYYERGDLKSIRYVLHNYDYKGAIKSNINDYSGKKRNYFGQKNSCELTRVKLLPNMFAYYNNDNKFSGILEYYVKSINFNPEDQTIKVVFPEKNKEICYLPKATLGYDVYQTEEGFFDMIDLDYNLGDKIKFKVSKEEFRNRNDDFRIEEAKFENNNFDKIPKEFWKLLVEYDVPSKINKTYFYIYMSTKDISSKFKDKIYITDKIYFLPDLSRIIYQVDDLSLNTITKNVYYNQELAKLISCEGMIGSNYTLLGYHKGETVNPFKCINGEGYTNIQGDILTFNPSYDIKFDNIRKYFSSGFQEEHLDVRFKIPGIIEGHLYHLLEIEIDDMILYKYQISNSNDEKVFAYFSNNEFSGLIVKECKEILPNPRINL